MQINILTNNSCPNSVAFNVPLLAAKKSFADHGYELNFFSDFSKKVFDSEILFINSNVFRSFWQEKKEEIFKFLEQAAQEKQHIVWFDTTDSTWCTQLEVLPYVDNFLKSQILADKKKYLTPFRTGRIFTDIFDELYDSGEKEVNYPSAEEKYLDKIDISWNTCFENYHESRYALKNKIRRKLTGAFWDKVAEPLNINFIEYDPGRKHAISCRVGLSHSRPSVVAHRQAMIEVLQDRGVETGKISLPEYFEELRNSQIGIGPFGVGEITLRDFEIIICGAVLLKPDMSHLQTWPELFVDGKTCITHQWDLTDLNQQLDKLLGNKGLCVELVGNAQKVYQDAISPEGMNKFAERLLDKIGKK